MQNPLSDLLSRIDAHIAEDVSAARLAQLTGYSFYHFCHLFKSVTGLPPGMYLRRRRLELAFKHLSGGGSVTEAALKFGFDTPSGFTKAFRKRYGISPGKYKTMKGSLTVMTPEIKKMAAFSAIGYTLAPPEGDFETLDSAAYWLGKDFSAVTKEDYAKLAGSSPEVGAWMHPDEVSGAFYYFFGPVVTDKSFVPEGMTVLDFPEAEYAVFSVPAADSPEALNTNIRAVMKSIFTQWMGTSGFALTHTGILFEYYTDKDTFIYVPVTGK